MQLIDTIAAILTAPGRSAVGIIRLSGAQALEIADQCYDGHAVLMNAPTHTIHYGWVKDPVTDARIDEALFLVMRNPRSYTGEDVVEIQCHGGHVALQEIFRVLMALGVRPAEEGEFTKRAFMNGKLDFTRAEAIMDIVDAKSSSALQIAVAQKAGSLEETIHTLREDVLELIAFIQADLDYPEDDIERLEDEQMLSRVEKMLEVLQHLIASGNRGRLYKEGLKMVIAGKPNVGKSSLLNALLGRERAIVTDIAGTTRDVVAEHLTIKGIPVEILDTAGIRETGDKIEAIGVERAKDASQKADLILYVVDATRGLDDEDEEFLKDMASKPLLFVVNKSDLKADYQLPEALGHIRQVAISAKVHEGIDTLEQTIYEYVMQDIDTNSSVLVNNVRHLALLEQSAQFLQSFKEGIEMMMSKDILVIDLQNTWENLGLITGESAADDLIQTIFSKFCLGK